MYICIIQPWMDYLGGAQILAFDMCQELVKQGHKVSLITTKFDDKKYPNKTFTVYETGFNGLISKLLCKIMPAMETSFILVLNRVKSKIRELKPDKVIVMNFPGNWITGRNVYWYCLEAPFAIYPDIVNPLEFKVNPSTGFKFIILRRIFQLIDKLIVKKHKRIISMSKRSNYFLKEIYNLPEAKIISPGVNVDYYDNFKVNLSDIKNKFNLNNNFNFLVVSRLHHAKNVILALKAFKLLKEKINNINLIVAGDGPELDELKRYSKHYELNVNFTGRISEHEKIGLYKVCDVVLYPCLYEPFGLVPVEAMLCSKPVIAVNEWGPTETIKHYKTGFLINNNENEFMNAMLHLSNDNKLRANIGKNGRKRAEKEFSIKVMIKKLTNYIKLI